MSGVFVRKPRTRIHVVIAVLLVHGATLSLIAVERRSSRLPSFPELQYVSFWPQVRVEPEIAERLSRQEVDRRTPSRPARVPSDHVVRTEDEPVLPSAVAERPVESVSPVDWNAAAKDAAARVAQTGGEQGRFSSAPRVLREPCKARVFDQDTKQLMEERLPEPEDPDLVGANPTASCIIVGGYPKCVQKITAKRRKREMFGDFVDARRTGRKAGTSAPSLETCE